MQQPLILQAVTPVHVENKSWEGKAYVSRTAYFLSHFIDREGKAYPATVKIAVPEGLDVRPGDKYTLGPDSFNEKEGKLSFSPRLVAAAGAGGAK